MSWRRTRLPPEDRWEDFGHQREEEQSNSEKLPPLAPQHNREGEPLDPIVRRNLEASFGANLGDVRIHRDQEAQDMAEAQTADAYAQGRDIYFAAGKYGEELLAHEVAHTIQQSGTGGASQGEDAALESEATHAASRVMQGSPAEVSRSAAAPVIQRQKTPGASGAMSWESPSFSFLPSQSVTLDGFDSDHAALKPDHLRTLDELAAKLIDIFTRYPDSFVSITGHTDATDSEQHNVALGQRRADAVRNYLISHGVPESAMRASSLGESMLKIDTKQREPRNRRVEIDIFQRSFRPKLPPLVVTPLLTPPVDPLKPPAKPPDLLPKLPVHIPTKEEEEAENIHHNEVLWEEAQKIKKKEAEEAERHPPGSSLSDFFSDKARDVAKSLGLPKWIQDKAADLAHDLPAKGLQALFNQIATDVNMDDRAREAVKKVLEALPQVKVK